jgi:hypothetical protein
MYFIKAVMDGVVKGENLPKSVPPWLWIESSRNSIQQDAPDPSSISSANTRNNVSANVYANIEYTPLAGPPPDHVASSSHLRSQSQPSQLAISTRNQPEYSLINRNNEAQTVFRRRSANPNANNPENDLSSPSASANISISNFNRDLPPIPTEDATLNVATSSNRPSNRKQNPNPNSEEPMLNEVLPDAAPEVGNLPPYTEVAPDM